MFDGIRRRFRGVRREDMVLIVGWARDLDGWVGVVSMELLAGWPFGAE